MSFSVTHRNDAIDHGLLQGCLRCLLQLGQQHCSDLLHREHFILIQIADLEIRSTLDVINTY